MPKSRCVTARLEIMPSVLALTTEYMKLHPGCNHKDAQGAAYMALHQELQRQTIMLKEEIFGHAR